MRLGGKITLLQTKMLGEEEKPKEV